MKKLIFLLLIFICSFIFNAYSNLKISRLPLVEYLPNNNVKKIFQCSDGYIWIGTEGGLCRYDGYDILQVSNKTNIDISNNILSIAEDKYGRIWAGTRQGIQIVDKHGRSINLLKNNKIQEKRINSICFTGDSAWIGTDVGLELFNIKLNTYKTFQHNPKQLFSLPSNNVVNIFSDKDGDLWLALWYNGLCKFNKKTQLFDKLPPIGSKNNPFHLMQDHNGAVWVSTWGDGLVRVDCFNNSQYKYNYYTVGGKNVVYSAVEDKAGQNLWFITPEGIYTRSKDITQTCTYINTRSIYEKSSNFFHAITKDKDGNIWVGASNDGIYLINTHPTDFKYNIIADVKNKVGYSIVNSIEEIDGLLWIGLTNAGVIALNPLENFKTIYYNNLGNTSIRNVKKDPITGSLWAMGDESFIIDFKTKLTTTSPIQWKTKDNLEIENSNCVYFANKSQIWFGTQAGLFLKQRSQNKLTLIANGFNNICAFARESDNSFWVASNNKGILRITIENKCIIIKSYSLKNKLAPTSMITNLMMDSKKRLWVGTNDCGLCIYNNADDKFVLQNDKFAILEKTITNIIEDKKGHLWLTSNNKILKIDIKKQFSTAYSSNDNDIQVSTFRPHSASLTATSNLYLGGNEGFCYFSTNINNQLSKINTKALITNIKVLNQSIFLDENNISFNSDKLSLKHNQNNFSIEFSSLNFNSSSNIKYAYRLLGLDNKWVYVDSKHRFANYNNLTSGTYQFEVKTTNNNGIWSEEITKLAVEINPAPYATWWAYSIYTVILLLIVVSLYRAVNNRIRLRNEAIIAKIEKEKTEELVQTKLKYFTNVSHELLTPLTIISCIVDELKQINGAERIHYSTLRANINRLKRLLQQILDFRKIESDNMDLRVEEDDLICFLQNICVYNFTPMLKEKNLGFNIKSSESTLKAWFDSDKIDKIVYNLLSNAIKYTPNGGSISVELSTESNETKITNAIITVSDTGVGISKELLPKIFDRFVSYKPNRETESNGIGLSLVKELVQLHRGSIAVKSEPYKGTCFTLTFPISKESYVNQSNIDVIEKT